MKTKRIVLLAAAFVAVSCAVIPSYMGPLARKSSAQGGEIATVGKENMSKPEAQDSTPVAAAAGPIMLGAAPARVSLKALNQDASLPAYLKSLAASRRVYLIVGDLHAAQQPGVAYHVFFDTPAGGKLDLSSPHYAGTINFYNAVKLEGSDLESKDARVFSFDITNMVNSLQAKRLLSEDTTVTMKPGGVPISGSQARVGRLEIVAE